MFSEEKLSQAEKKQQSMVWNMKKLYQQIIIY